MQRYKLDELDLDTRQQAIDRISTELAENFDCSWLTECLNSELVERGWKGLRVAGWSLGHSQGDGVDLEGDVDLEAIAEAPPWLLKALRALSLRGIFLSLGVRHSCQCRYHNQNSMDVTVTYLEGGRDITKLENKVIQLLEEKLTEVIRSLSHDLEKLGYADLEYNSSEECVLQYVSDRDLEFDVYGNELDPVPADTKQLLLFKR